LLWTAARGDVALWPFLTKFSGLLAVEPHASAARGGTGRVLKPAA
jgi:hypothetical protein